MKSFKKLLLIGILLLNTTLIQAEDNEWETLNKEADTLYQQGQYEQATEKVQKALVAAEKALGPEHPDVAGSLNYLAALYRTQGQYEKAEPLYQRLLTIREKALGPEHPDVAQSLSNLAALYDSKGQYKKAEPLYQRSLAIREKALGPNHPDVARSLSNLASLYSSKGQYKKAEPLYLRSLAIREKALGPNHPDVALSINNLAELYRTQGQYEKAEPLYLRALAIREKALGPEHPNVAISLNNLAVLYESQGQYAKAEPLYLRALAISEKALGPEHLNVATSLNNLALLYNTQGQNVKAEPLYHRSLAIREKALGPEHPDVALSLNNLALLYNTQGQNDKAEPLYQRSLAIFEKALGPDHPNVAKILNNLADIYRTQGQYEKAEPLYQRSLIILEKALGPEHPDVAISLGNFALLYQIQGQHEKAKPFYQRSLAISEKALGSNHPNVASVLQNQSIILWTQGNSGDFAHPLELFQRSIDIREYHLQQFITRGSEQDKRDYMATIRGDTDAMTSFHLAAGSANQAATRLALTTVLQRKGRLLDAVTDSIATLRRHLNPEDETLLDQWAKVNEQRANLFMQAQHGKIPQEQYFSRKTQLETQAHELEVKISARSAEFKVQTQPITLERVQQAMPSDTALVEYLRYQPINPKKTIIENRRAPARYIAYVLKANGEPQSVELGEAAAIDQLVNDWRKTLGNGRNPEVTALARKLDAKIMQPVRAVLGETQTLLVSPDGALNLIPFAALQDEHHRYFVERFSLTYLSSGRDLLRLDSGIESVQSVTLLADVDFGNSDSPAQQVADRGTGSRRSVDFNAQFQPLPGTKAEAQAIGHIVPSATILTGQQASESALKQLDRPHILHIATHGFFLSDLPDHIAQSRGVPLMGVSSLDSPRKTNPLTDENPLLRSGLALANANRLASGEDDGVLTAMEAANLDLWGTQLVVLSACETGVGEVHNGQGVFGLRRALVIAGSESQVMSLWKVDDDATKDLMVDYYQRLLNNEGRSNAMRQVQLAMLNSPERNHPYYWASFIVSGDWKPIGGSKLTAKISNP